MPTQQDNKKQSCCLAVISNVQTAGLACLELHFGCPQELAVSLLIKPEAGSDCETFFRLKSVGTIACRGPVGQLLKQQSLRYPDKVWEVDELLNLIGVPAHHEKNYGRALKVGSAILVLQGDGKTLRHGYGILKNISLNKPVLYLV